MESKFFLGFLAILATVEISASQDIDVMLNDKVIVQRQINCALDRGPCDALGKQIKAVIPEVVTNNCRRCSRVQAKMAQQVTDFMKKNYPNEFLQIVKNQITRKG